MKFKNILVLIVLVTFIFSSSICASVYAQVPQLPAAYYGTVKLITSSGLADASAPTVIKAYVGDVECGSITTTEPGEYGGPKAGDPKLIVQGDIESGVSLVTFYVNGIMAEENVTWVSGDVKQVNLTAYPAPDAKFTATPRVGVQPLTVQFTDTTLVVADTWLWSFGDGTTGTEQNPTHTYSLEGAYTVSLTITKGFVTDTETKLNLIIVTAVQPAYVAEEEIVGAQQDYVVEAPQSNTTVTVDTTGDVDVTVVTYAENPHPAVPLPQGVIVMPKYIDITVSDPDAVIWPIYAKMSYTTADLAGINENQLVGLYYWDSGTGAWSKCSDTGVNTTDFNGYSGYLWARMTRSEVSGAPIIPGADTTPPVAVISATPTSGTSPLTVSFNGGASTDNIGIVSYSWSFGDGTTGTGVTTTHAYVAGTYTATLTVRDAAGNTDTDSLTITVSEAPPPPTNKRPVADAGLDQTAYVNDTVHFNGANSYDPDGTIMSWRWSFGDGETASGVEVSHSYSESGSYTVTLTVEDNEGKEDTDTCIVAVTDTTAPVIIHTAVTSAYSGVAFDVSASVTDNVGVSSVTLYYKVTGAANYTSAAMSLVSGSTYSATVPASAVTTAGVDYYIAALDSSSNSARAPATGAYTVTVSTVIVSQFVVTASEPALKDVNGNAIANTTAGTQVLLATKLTNHAAVDKALLYIVQVKDSTGHVVFLSFVSSTVPAATEYEFGIAWTPSVADMYTVEVFVWNSWTVPDPFSEVSTASVLVV